MSLGSRCTVCCCAAPEQPGPDLLSRTRTVGAGTLLAATPIGDFLLVTGELVDQEPYQAALAALDD
ncbi:hypothetical protein [Kitasatospora aureofaciens]|uniref:hypothetical protein n=1 Tax=Kitasatospora aureofaciens TaxID=1894 RepID=UPI0036F49E1D